jgi:TRAP-type mannitol/chloroaromatic compound transport system permease small subunit
VVLPGTAGPPARASVFGVVLDGLNGLGSVLIFAVMFLICADVLARGVFNAPIYGVAELVSISIVAIVFLQLGSTLRHERMSRAELFIEGFRQRHPTAGGLLQSLFDLAGIAVCGMLLYASWPIFLGAWTGKEFLGVPGQLTVPTWPVKLIVLVGCAATAAQYAVNFCRDMRLALAPPREPDR